MANNPKHRVRRFLIIVISMFVILGLMASYLAARFVNMGHSTWAAVLKGWFPTFGMFLIVILIEAGMMYLGSGEPPQGG